MAALILFGLLSLPLIEIAVFIKVGGWIGVWPTVLLTVAFSVLGVQLVRAQGLAMVARAREAARRNEPPVDDMLDGLCGVVGGFLLIIPGFVTDALGLLLFVPWVRRRLRGLVWRGVATETHWRRGRGTVIETEYTVVRESEPKSAQHDGGGQDDRREIGHDDRP